MSNQTTKTVQVDDSGALVAPAASTFKTANALLGSGETASDVDPTGTAIAEALALKAQAPSVSTSFTLNWATSTVYRNTLSGNTTYSFSNVKDGMTLRQYVTQTAGWGINWPTGVTWVSGSAPGNPASGETKHIMYVRDGATTYGYEIPTSVIKAATLKALSTTGLVVQNSAGTEKLKVGANTGADVQVTGDLSVSAAISAQNINASALKTTATITSSNLVSGEYTFVHNRNDQLVVIQTYDNSYQMMIPDNITLTNANSATIDFSTFEPLVGNVYIIAI
jgi:hypothetical protein